MHILLSRDLKTVTPDCNAFVKEITGACAFS
jgi:hypothetical protein